MGIIAEYVIILLCSASFTCRIDRVRKMQFRKLFFIIEGACQLWI